MQLTTSNQPQTSSATARCKPKDFPGDPLVEAQVEPLRPPPSHSFHPNQPSARRAFSRRQATQLAAGRDTLVHPGSLARVPFTMALAPRDPRPRSIMALRMNLSLISDDLSRCCASQTIVGGGLPPATLCLLR